MQREYSTLKPILDTSSAFRNYFEREQSLCELDSIFALIFSIDKDELLDLYQYQFIKNRNEFLSIAKKNDVKIQRLDILKKTYEWAEKEFSKELSCVTSKEKVA